MPGASYGGQVFPARVGFFQTKEQFLATPRTFPKLDEESFGKTLFVDEGPRPDEAGAAAVPFTPTPTKPTLGGILREFGG